MERVRLLAGIYNHELGLVKFHLNCVTEDASASQPASWEERLKAERNSYFPSSFQQIRKLLNLVFVKGWHLQPEGLQRSSCQFLGLDTVL